MAVGEVEYEALRQRLLDAAEDLFYARGIQAVGMDEIRGASGLPLRRIYQLYPTKEDLVVGFLERRDVGWRGRLAAYADSFDDPRQRVLAVFDWLHEWFNEPGFRGCAWINAYGELGSTSSAVSVAVREHKHAFHAYVTRLVRAFSTDHPASRTLADAVCLLAEGAIVTAAIDQDPRVALRARAAASAMLEAHSGGRD